jgi:hypothetical protein
MISKNAQIFLDAVDGLLNLNPSHKPIQNQVDAALYAAVNEQATTLKFLNNPTDTVVTYIEKVQDIVPDFTVENAAIAGAAVGVVWFGLECTDRILAYKLRRGKMNRFVAAIPHAQPMDIEEGGDMAPIPPPPRTIEEVQQRIFDYLEGPSVGQKRGLQYPLETLREVKRMRPDVTNILGSAILWF